jgi:hypothetical protein
MGNIRPICCGKKRKSSQLVWKEGYDGVSFFCKNGYGCKKQNHYKTHRIEPVFDGSGTSVDTYKIVDANGTLQFIGSKEDCEALIK